MERFSLKNKKVVITGGTGMLGIQHFYAVAEAGGFPILFDIDEAKYKSMQKSLADIPHEFICVDITKKKRVQESLCTIKQKGMSVDVLINNAALNPKFDQVSNGGSSTRLENYSIELFNKEVSVGLTGALICSQVFGAHMAEIRGGVILNICSDLGMIAPDQRLYSDPNQDTGSQAVKPVSYSIIKHGLVGLTRYLATYWPNSNIRCNALLPGGVYENQADEFVNKLQNLIPMGRMASKDEYRGAIQFLISDASKYMNGSMLVMDGGRTCW